MATDYRIVVVPDTGGTRPCIECPQCLGLQLLCTHVHVYCIETTVQVKYMCRFVHVLCMCECAGWYSVGRSSVVGTVTSIK